MYNLQDISDTVNNNKNKSHHYWDHSKKRIGHQRISFKNLKTRFVPYTCFMRGLSVLLINYTIITFPLLQYGI